VALQKLFAYSAIKTTLWIAAIGKNFKKWIDEKIAK